MSRGWALLAVGAVLATAGSTCAQSAQPSTPKAAVLAASDDRALGAMVAALGRADVVFVGEDHDDATAHQLELRILTALHAARPRVALGLEMFDRDVQLPLDEYLAGQITEASFLQASRPWPNYKSDYRPLVELCRSNRLPVIATNAPRRYVNMVSREGPDAVLALTREAKGYLAKLPISTEMPAGYASELRSIFSEAHGAPAQGMPSTENMIAAQALWDATMADSIARFRRAHRDTLVVHVNGAMHTDHGWGIADRLQRQLPRARIAVVSLKPDAASPPMAAGKYDGVADYVIITPPKPAEAPTASR